MRQRFVLILLTAIVVAFGRASGEDAILLSADSVPAVPLVACDPYFSIWSTAPTLTGADTTHWTGKPHRLTALVVVDGRPYRVMGAQPASIDPLDQISSSITLTKSAYRFRGGGVEVGLEFVTPALPSDLDVLSRPITYANFQIAATDGQAHDVRIYFEASAELTVNTPDQAVVGSVTRPEGLTALKLGSRDQAVLESKGDDIRIDWGYFYLAAHEDAKSSFAIGAPASLRTKFVSGSPLIAPDDARASRADDLAAAVAFDLPKVGSDPQSRWLVVAYDDISSIEFMGRPLVPYWRRNGRDADALLAEAAHDRAALLEACDEFDRELTDDLVRAGGKEYAAIASLAYRQCFAAGKLVADANGQPISFCKENHSNGCIATSDVFYPMSPQFLLFGPSLAKSFVVPFMEYAASDRWKFPFAPHDLGTYPLANGQVYGGGERTEENQMPVEESGNLLILMAAIAKVDGNADFASRYWPQLERWAGYLREKGLNPENQLCTDDFAGHLAQNVNLSAKAICGLGAFAQLCELRGDVKQAAEYRAVAEEFARRWVKEADDGDHFRLAFDKPGTWSQKYNLVWDRVLGLNLFPDSVVEKEVAYYRGVQNRFGLPLDNREDYTKLDWILWTATLTQDREDFDALVHPVYEFLREAPDRAPMTDWYQTKTAKKVGFTARPVVGGVFMQLLHDKAVWNKWASRDMTQARDYARIRQSPAVEVVVPTADAAPTTWRFTTDAPAENWFDAGFDDSAWQQGGGGFGTPGTPGAQINTTWDTPQIWLRRTFDLPVSVDDSLRLQIYHDEDSEIFLNGILAKRVHGFKTEYQTLRIRPEALQTLKPTGNVLAVRCRQTAGGQFIDVGVAKVGE